MFTRFFTFLALSLFLGLPAHARVQLGIDVLAQDGYAALQGKRVGLITNQTGIDSSGTRTRVLLKRNTNLVALYTPEHGLDGTELAGKYVKSRRDPITGVMAHSLYGPTRKPTPAMLAGVDVLVFDMQDIGCRSYTYISTMGRCMEAAGEAGIPFVVLDRPNPLGGNRIEGPSVESRWISFVGQFPVPYVHGMTTGELAKMANAKGWTGARCNLTVVPMRGWSRNQTWENTGLRWIRTSPNIPRGTSPFYYVATGIIGSLSGVDIGVGGPLPFEYVRSSAVDSASLTRYLRSLDMPGVRFSEHAGGSRLHINPDAPANLTAINLHLIEAINRRGGKLFGRTPAGKMDIFTKVYGSTSLRTRLQSGASASSIVASWRANEQSFRRERASYLLY
ncbi:DUF1343 domain-containing protein [soil metagenome]|nr:DUF1343 domain-containing protein [Chthoniobacterales bacterium]